MRSVGVPSPSIRAPSAIEEMAQVDDLRLDGRAADDRRAPGQHGGAQDVGRAGHRGAAGPDRSIVAPISRRARGHDVAVLQPQVGPQGGQALQVQIDRPVADVAAAGQRHDGPAAPGQQRPQHAEAGPHPPHQSYPARTGARIDRLQAAARRRASTSLARPDVRAPRPGSARRLSRGTPSSRTGSSARIAAAMIGSAAFFDAASADRRRAEARRR